MTAGTYNIIIEQGATFARTLTWQADSANVNLTGYTARMMIRSTIDDSSTIVSLTTENGGITLGGAAGTIALLISATATAALTAGTAVYDLELISASSVVTRLLQGSVTIAREVTR
jgi:hypothetical protein